MSPSHDSNLTSLAEKAGVKMSVLRTADHYIYELSAFLTALKSCLDFFATACSSHFVGTHADSIRTLIHGVEQKGKSGPVFHLISKHLAWLKQVREYRHHLVHRMVLAASAGHEIHRRGRHLKAVTYPVAVPQSTPSYVPDTRRHRMLGDADHLDSVEFESSVMKSDG